MFDKYYCLTMGGGREVFLLLLLLFHRYIQREYYKLGFNRFE